MQNSEPRDLWNLKANVLLLTLDSLGLLVAFSCNWSCSGSFDDASVAALVAGGAWC